LALILLLAAVLLPTLWWRKPLWQRAQFLYWQHRCLGYDPPPDGVLSELDSQKVTALLRRSRDYIRTPAINFVPDDSGKPRFVPTIALHQPECWRMFRRLDPHPQPLLSFDPGVWPIVFLHERRSIGGARRLIVVLARHNYSHAQMWDLEWTSITPASLLGTTAADQGLIWIPGFWGVDIAPASISPGRVDPADLSRFTIQYQMGGKSVTVTGRLQDNGKVELLLPEDLPAPSWSRATTIEPETRPVPSGPLGPPVPE
jgi:hypothetical protein